MEQGNKLIELSELHKIELDKLYSSLQLAIIIETIFISIIFAIANASIQVEATSVLASNNSIGSNAACSTANTIKGYYACELNITKIAYIPQYQVLLDNIFLLLIFLSFLIVLLMISQHISSIKVRSNLLLIIGLVLVVLLTVSALIFVHYANTFINSDFFSILFFIVFIVPLIMYFVYVISVVRNVQKIAKNYLGYVLIILSLPIFYFAITTENFYFHIATSNINNFFLIFVGIGEFFMLAIFGAILFAFGVILASPETAAKIYERMKNKL